MTNQLANLNPKQSLQLLVHSQSTCEACSKRGILFLLQVGGADPTDWQLCCECHPKPGLDNVVIDVQFAEWLGDNQGYARFADYLDSLHRWDSDDEHRDCYCGHIDCGAC